MVLYLLLGIIQGIFEWIPISSEGVVVLAGRFFIKELNIIDLALFLHFGTLLAVLVYFRKDWKEVLTLRNHRLFRFLMISTLVSLATGFPIYKIVKNMVIGNNLLVMIGFGFLLTAYFHKKKIVFGINFDKLAIVVGFLQGLAVIPGLSRSGSTIFGLSLGKIKPAEILKISYMMSVPVVLASSLYLFLENPILNLKTWPALFSSFIVGFFSLDFLLRISQKINFFNFALIFALLCFLGAGIGSLI